MALTTAAGSIWNMLGAGLIALIMMLQGCVSGTTNPGSVPAKSDVLTEPPALTIMALDECRAERLTYSWTVQNADGTFSAIEADAAHPLDIYEDLPCVSVEPGGSMVVSFETEPVSVYATYWRISDIVSPAEAGMVYEAGDSLGELADLSLTLPLDEPCVVQLYATWVSEPDADGVSYSGSSYYAFRTQSADETPDTSQAQLVLKPHRDTEPDISTMPLGIFLTVTDYADGVLTAVFSNQSGYTMTVSADYALQQLVDGVWQDMEPVQDYSWVDLAWILDDLDELEMTYDLSVFGELEPGTYKLCASELEAEFELVWADTLS